MLGRVAASVSGGAGEGGVERRLRKIERSEEKGLKILYKQRKELTRALEDNDRLIVTKLEKTTPQEAKLEQEIDKLQKRLDQLNEEVGVLRSRREEQITPLRERTDELREKLKLVDSQIESTLALRERRRSGSTLNLTALGGGGGADDSLPSPSGDVSVASPPPAYSPFWPRE